MDLNRTLTIVKRQLTKAREPLRRLHVRVQGHNGHARRPAEAEHQEREMADQMDGLMRHAKVMRCSTSQGIPLGPLLGSYVNIALGRDFRQNTETSFMALLDQASHILWLLCRRLQLAFASDAMLTSFSFSFSFFFICIFCIASLKLTKLVLILYTKLIGRSDPRAPRKRQSI